MANELKALCDRLNLETYDNLPRFEILKASKTGENTWNIEVKLIAEEATDDN